MADPRYDIAPLLTRAAELSLRYLAELPERHVGATDDAAEIAARLRVPLPASPEDPLTVIERLASDVDRGLVASAGPRYFGFVIGGALPASIATDWLTAAWDQNASLHVISPAASAAEDVAAEWMKDLLGIPGATSHGLTTGAGLANAVGLATARHAVLAALGYDVEKRGLFGAPEIAVVLGEEAHATIATALQYLGLGHERVIRIPADEQGSMRAEPLADTLAALCDKPVIVCAQAGNVNTGGFDPLSAIADAVDAHPNAWLHVDGAFGLWARAAPARRHLARGVDRADSWSTDAHKWLNTPYDCGIALTRHADAHRRALRGGAAYLPDGDAAVRTAFDFAPELSRRARGFALWAALRQLGRAGVADLVERCCVHAARIADGLAAIPGIEIMHAVELNQIVLRCHDPRGVDDDAHTRAVLERVIAGGECYPTASVWRGLGAIRISVSNWTTDADDVARTVAAIAAAHAG
jgi:glutamate/tyrosine decarboxylase-like PLP-dependent enzyme